MLEFQVMTSCAISETFEITRIQSKKYTRVSQTQLRVDSYLLRRLTYTNEIWHMHAMNYPASEYAIYKTM